MQRRVNDQCAPATSDVEHRVTWIEHELATNMIELGLLSAIKIIVRPLKVGTRIHHGVVEPQRIKIVRHVIVKRNRIAVFCLRVFFNARTM